MNDKAISLLQALAEKMGTTTQYLWSVLLKQAPISGITDLIQYAIIAVGAYLYWRWVASDKRDFSSGGDSWPGGLILGALVAIFVGAAFFSFPHTVAAFINPEYWALDKVLSAVKSR